MVTVWFYRLCRRWSCCPWGCRQIRPAAQEAGGLDAGQRHMRTMFASPLTDGQSWGLSLPEPRWLLPDSAPHCQPTSPLQVSHKSLHACHMTCVQT